MLCMLHILYFCMDVFDAYNVCKTIFFSLSRTKDCLQEDQSRQLSGEPHCGHHHHAKQRQHVPNRVDSQVN